MKPIDEVVSKYSEGLTKDFEKILKEVATDAYIKGKNVALSELITMKQLSERLGISNGRACTIIAKANKERGIGIQLTGNWMVLESEIELLRPGKSGRPSTTYDLNLKISKSLIKIIEDKVATVISETKRVVTINDLICQALEESFLKDVNFAYTPDFEIPAKNNTSISVTLGSRAGTKVSKAVTLLSSKFDKKITKQDLILQVLYKKFWSEEQNNLFIDIIDNIDDR